MSLVSLNPIQMKYYVQGQLKYAGRPWLQREDGTESQQIKAWQPEFGSPETVQGLDMMALVCNPKHSSSEVEVGNRRTTRSQGTASLVSQLLSYCCDKDTMTNETWRRKCLTELVVPEG